MNTTFNLPEAGGAISISVEALAPESYTDLIKRRRPGHRYRPAVGEKRAISVSYRDLIVLTSFNGMPLGTVAAAIDTQLDGALSRAIDVANFQARQGETLVFDLEARGLGSGNARRILMIGLGDPALSGQFVYCGLVGCVINEAAALEAEQVLLPLTDLTVGTSALSMQRFTSILRCRIKQHLTTEVEHGRLKKVRLVVGDDKKDEAETGLQAGPPLCRICADPTF